MPDRVSALEHYRRLAPDYDASCRAVAAMRRRALALLAPGKSIAEVFRTQRLAAHLFRGVCVVLSNLTYFAALATMPLAEASAIFFVAPLLITASSAILLREHVGAWRWSALAVGMGWVCCRS